MASITKRGPYQWQAIIRRKRFPTQTKTFETKQAAEEWASEVERSMRRDTFADRKMLEDMTLHELFERYAAEVTPTKRGWRPELSRVKSLMGHPIAALTLASLRAQDVAAYRDERLGTKSNKTVREELMLLSAILNHARNEWSIAVENCVQTVKKPPAPPARARRLQASEEKTILAAARESKNKGLETAIVLAFETGMRRGKIAELRWEDVDFASHMVRLKTTKNGDSRNVPLTERAERVLRELPHSHGDKVFGFFDADGLTKAFTRACGRAKITDLHFHDLRHEAASRMARRMQCTTLAKVMGWKSIQMAMRYDQPYDDELLDAVRNGETRGRLGTK